jgi:hypothetical protein
MLTQLSTSNLLFGLEINVPDATIINIPTQALRVQALRESMTQAVRALCSYNNLWALQQYYLDVVEPSLKCHTDVLDDVYASRIVYLCDFVVESAAPN